MTVKEPALSESKGVLQRNAADGLFINPTEILPKRRRSSYYRNETAMKHLTRHNRCELSRKVLIPAFSVVLSIAIIISASADDSGGKEAFRRGRENLHAGRFREAAINLLIAQKEFGILEDYSLYYLSDAYHNLGEHMKSRESLRLLLDKYPSSLLRKKARAAEIRAAKDYAEQDLPGLYEAFIRDFPEDDAYCLAYAQLLKKKGDVARAAALFKKLYIRAGSLSASAKEELNSEEITASDMLERASNLIKQYEFDSAERDLRLALARCSDGNRMEIIKNLAYTLFKQKKYKEASELYGQVNDLFFKARSMYRAGNKEGFEKILTAMTAANDKKAGALLISAAADKRREKDFDHAGQLYQDILKNYPAEAEEAMWGLGWTQYLSGNYSVAAETFSGLHTKYNDPKYLYWQARSTESAGGDPSELFSKLTADRGSYNFYSALAYAKNHRMLPQLASLPVQPDRMQEKPGFSGKIEALISLDMRAEAISELTASCRNISSASELIYSLTVFQELGEFKRSISLATKIPYSDQVHRFWYPRAFWDKVERASQQHNVDPFIVLSVMREESRFDQTVKSPAGAYGLMQLMPMTAYRLDKSLHLGIHMPAQLTDPDNNIQLGSFYLKSLLKEFGSVAHMLAAYNAGESAVRSWQQRSDYRSVDEFIEDIPYNETRNYVKKVISSYFQYRREYLPEQEKNSGMELIFGSLL
jgi:soluble lytic murein transglycosylase